MKVTLLLFLVIFLEGYAVLSTELLAMRQVIPFVGSNTDTMAIIIAAVLMPLAFGYAYGGRFRPYRLQNGAAQTIRGRLLLNLSFSAVILCLGLSHAVMEVFFTSLNTMMGIRSPVVLTTLYALCFIALPVFMMAQTVPLVSHYFKRQALSSFAGKVLFYSTLGSFMGAVFCTLVLMPYIGVNHSVTVTIACLTVLTFLLSPRRLNGHVIAAVIALALSVALNSDAVLKRLNIVANNQYNTVQVYESEDGAVNYMRINATYASAVHTQPEDRMIPVFDYIAYVERTYIAPLARAAQPVDILVIGAGGFTLGLGDHRNHYTFLDIDGQLKEVAERDFLKEKLGPNKIFVPAEARAYLAYTDRTFDMIFLDAYQDISGVPTHLVTKEFFEQVRSALKPGGVMVGNFITSPFYADRYSRRLDNTLRSVFPYLNRQMLDAQGGWPDRRHANLIYSAINQPDDDNAIYTDRKNQSFMDKRKAP